MALNTVKTTVGYLRTLLGKYTPLRLHAESLDDIYNYIEISATISTSGQPSAEQFELVKAAGFMDVINLAPHDAENALDDEANVMAQLGLFYTHIPIDFRHPTQADFDRFCGEMTALRDRKVWVHCAANMRVSAFIYRYRCEILGDDCSVARQDLARIWTPFGVWKKFVFHAA
ncbi:MAG: protein tyrosine phosphatase family protein [Halioglobus sp.]|nr:protein tyrosine phosphatase family protein [Halioglobus sp.]